MNLDDKNLNKGATMIEYALISGLIAIVAIGAMTSLGKRVSSKMDHIATSLDGQTSTDDSDGGTGDVPSSDVPSYDLS